MTSKGKRTAKKSAVSAFAVPPEGYQVLFTVTCAKCGEKEPTFSLEGRFPQHCSPANGRSVCIRSGSEFLLGEKRRVQWRVVEKVVLPEATERHDRLATTRAATTSTGTSARRQKGRRNENRAAPLSRQERHRPFSMAAVGCVGTDSGLPPDTMAPWATTTT